MRPVITVPRPGLRALVALAAAALLAPAALVASAAPAAAADCAPVAVLAFRGSGQANVDPGVVSYAGAPHRYGASRLVTNGWEGPTLARLLERVAPADGITGLRGEDVPVYAIGVPDAGHPTGYPAVSVGWDALGAINTSALAGAAEAQRVIAEVKRERGSRAAGCAAETKFVLLGYSQGAMAARYTAAVNRQDVVGLLLLGDPLQKADADGVFGGGSGGSGIFRLTYRPLDLTGAVRLDGWDDFYDWPGVVRHAICHARDIICDTVRSSLPLMWILDGRKPGSAEHLDYFTTRAETEDFVGRYMRTAEHAVARAVPTGRDTDIAIVVDTKGDPADAVLVANRLISKARLLAEASKVRMAVVDFSAPDDEAYVVSPLTDDLDAVQASVGSLVARSSGGVGGTAAYAGLATAATSLAWSPGAARSTVVIGDEVVHDPDPASDASEKALLDLLAQPAASTARSAGDGAVESEPIVVYGLAAGSGFDAGIAPFADATGGFVAAAAGAVAADAASARVIDDVATAPDAVLGTLAVAEAGVPIPVTATASFTTDAGLTVAFDLDGDGTYETPASDTTLWTPPGPGAATIGVRVTDAAGRVSEEKRTIVVTEPAPAVPTLDKANPTLALSLAGSASPGDVVSVRAGVPAGADVAVALVPADQDVWTGTVAHLVTGVADAAGAIDVALPASIAPGRYSVLAAASGAQWGRASLAVTAPAAGAAGRSGELARSGIDAVPLVATGAVVAVGLLVAGAVLIRGSRRRAV